MNERSTTLYDLLRTFSHLSSPSLSPSLTFPQPSLLSLALYDYVGTLGTGELFHWPSPRCTTSQHHTRCIRAVTTGMGSTVNSESRRRDHRSKEEEEEI